MNIVLKAFTAIASIVLVDYSTAQDVLSENSDKPRDKLVEVLESHADPISLLTGDVEISEEKTNAVVDCGHVWCDDTKTVKIRLTNNLADDFEATSIKTSCGCIAGLPDNVHIAAGGSTPMKAVFTVPTAVGEFDRLITISEKDLGRSIRIRLVGKAAKRFEVGNPEIVFEEPGSHVVSLNLSRVSDDKFDDLVWRMEAANDGKVNLKVDEAETSAVATFQYLSPPIDSLATEEVAYLTAKKGEVVMLTYPIRMIYGYRSYTKPSRLVLKEFNDSYKMTFVLHKSGFIGEEDDGAERKMTLILPVSGSGKTPVDCIAKVRRATKNSTIVTIVVEAKLLSDWSGDEFAELEIDGSGQHPLRVSVLKN